MVTSARKFSCRTLRLIQTSQPLVIPQVLFGLAALVLFWPAIAHDSVLAFRDSLQFYFPTWYWIEQTSQASGISSFSIGWNPLSGFGYDLAGEPTGWQFYPPALLLHTNFASMSAKLGWFLWSHVVFANLAMTCFVRFRLRSNWHGAHLAGFSYALGIPVFFQIYNPIYLVGAAWTPLALAGFARDSRKPQIAIAGIAIGMMILGGDAQGAVNIVVAVLAMLCGQLTFELFVQIRERKKLKFWSRVADWMRQLVKVLGTVVLGGVIALPQIVATLRWISDCGRIGLQREQIMEYSLAPWHLITLAIPYFFGSMVPGHSRWSFILSDEPRMWLPSLFVGSFTLVSAGSYFRTRVVRNRSLIPKTSINVGDTASMLPWICFIACLSAFGCFGFGWMIDGIVRLVLGNRISLPWLGTLYDVWLTVIPLYDHFRYPAKWTVLFSAAICAMAGKGFSDRTKLPSAECHASQRHLPKRFATIFVFVSLSVFGLIVACQAWLVPMAIALEDFWYGKFNAQNFWIIHTKTIWLVGIWWFAWIVGSFVQRQRDRPRLSFHVSHILLAIAFAELFAVSAASTDFVAQEQLVAATKDNYLQSQKGDKQLTALETDRGVDLTTITQTGLNRLHYLSNSPQLDSHFSIRPSATNEAAVQKAMLQNSWADKWIESTDISLANGRKYTLRKRKPSNSIRYAPNAPNEIRLSHLKPGRTLLPIQYSRRWELSPHTKKSTLLLERDQSGLITIVSTGAETNAALVFRPYSFSWRVWTVILPLVVLWIGFHGARLTRRRSF